MKKIFLGGTSCFFIYLIITFLILERKKENFIYNIFIKPKIKFDVATAAAAAAAAASYVYILPASDFFISIVTLSPTFIFMSS
jgi:hypothetical protein